MAPLIRRGTAAALIALLPAAHAGQGSLADLRTAYAYNFVVLSTWPAETPALLKFCVAGDPIATTQFRVLAGKAAGDRVLLVAGAPKPSQAGDCQVLYIPVAESERTAAWLAAVAKRPTLTISEEAGAPGAMVNLRLEANRIVFDVDTRASAAAHIVMSSQLLKLAATRQ